MPISDSPFRYSRALVWLRRDLRLHDNHALHAALREAREVCIAFIYDSVILDALPTRTDRRVEFISLALDEVHEELQSHGSGLTVVHGPAASSILRLAFDLQAQAVFANHDDEPYALQRDHEVQQGLQSLGKHWHSFKDHVIFERSEVLTGAGKPFSVFTPYKNAWLKRFESDGPNGWPIALSAQRLMPRPKAALPTLDQLGFTKTNLTTLAMGTGRRGGMAALQDFAQRIGEYAQARDFPAVRGPSYLSVHLRFGTVSIRECVALATVTLQADPNAAEGARIWLSELIWRDFYHQILHHHPRVVERAFKPEYDRIVWDDRPDLFTAWCEARTGYPLVDAAMRQINTTGYMHNRLRMVVASFLTKDLGLDWRLGEAYFAAHLNDFDLAANNGGWQWAASSGCDAQPYFRIFNPVTQSEKFDPKGKFIRRYLPELADLSDKAIHAPWLSGHTPTGTYPAPVVDHAVARTRTLARYTVVKSDASAAA